MPQSCKTPASQQWKQWKNAQCRGFVFLIFALFLKLKQMNLNNIAHLAYIVVGWYRNSWPENRLSLIDLPSSLFFKIPAGGDDGNLYSSRWGRAEKMWNRKQKETTKITLNFNLRFIIVSVVGNGDRRINLISMSPFWGGGSSWGLSSLATIK